MGLGHLMRGFTIRLRMWGAIVMVLASLALIGGIGVWSQLYANGITQNLVNRDMAAQAELGRLQQAIAAMRLNEKDMVIQYENSVEAQRYGEAWHAAYAKAQASASALSPLLSSEAQRAQLAGISAALNAFSQGFDAFGKRLDHMDFQSTQIASATLDQLTPAIVKAQTELASLADALKQATDASQQQLSSTVARVVWLIAGATLVLVLLIVPLTLSNMHSICGPIDQAEEVAKAIAQGDLTDQGIDARGSDEAARLLASLGDMQHSLSRLVGQVRNAVDSLGTASAEIASGNQDLSTRTEQAAGNLQRTASSMDQLTQTVQQSADASRQAQQLALTAGEVAARGGAVVDQVVTTMNDINLSSKKIADIIGVIDGIAFQTNILALNAAVEAARAGEQGRGFAVVASEVRSLAGRSADAAREIKGLIGASVERVENGSRLVGDAGRTMAEIVGSVQRVCDIISQITDSAAAQSHGIGEVNSAIAQLDQMTQQNAALVEQSAAAAHSMSEQTRNLAGLVSTFKVNTSGALRLSAA